MYTYISIAYTYPAMIGGLYSSMDNIFFQKIFMEVNFEINCLSVDKYTYIAVYMQ